MYAARNYIGLVVYACNAVYITLVYSYMHALHLAIAITYMDSFITYVVAIRNQKSSLGYLYHICMHA